VLLRAIGVGVARVPATVAAGRRTGSKPFLSELLKKMSPKLGAMTERMPKPISPKTAVSREEPTPKLRPATAITARRYGS
jgi:hypothetical protein